MAAPRAPRRRQAALPTLLVVVAALIVWSFTGMAPSQGATATRGGSQPGRMGLEKAGGSGGEALGGAGDTGSGSQGSSDGASGSEHAGSNRGNGSSIDGADGSGSDAGGARGDSRGAGDDARGAGGAGAGGGATPPPPSLPRVGWLGHVFGERPPSGLSLSEAVRVASDNFGNMVWAYGAWMLLDHSAVRLVPLEHPYRQPVDAVLLPTANMLLNASKYELIRQYTQTLLDVASKQRRAPIALVGLGSQVRFEDALGGRQRRGAAPYSAAARVRLAAPQADLLRLVQRSGGFVATRGKFTAAIVEGAGLPAPLPLGCPSLFINHNPRLGEVLRAKWDAVLAARDPRLRLAITLPKIHRDLALPDALLRVLAGRLLARFPASVVVLQTVEDAQTVQLLATRYGAPLSPDRVRYFYDVRSWVDGLAACCDAVFGWRIHGTMAGLAAELPGVVIGADFRIKELADAMRLPSMDALEARLDPDSFDLFDFMAAVRGPYTRFDQRRRDVAREYGAQFGRLGLPLHPGIRALAEDGGGA